MTIVSSTVGKNPLEEMEQPSQSTKEFKMKYFTSVPFQDKPFSVTVIQVYAPTTNAEEAEVERFYEDLQDLLELTPPKRCPFLHKGLECKSRNSRDIWSNRQI